MTSSALYEADYIRAWDAMINDLNVVPLRSLSQAAQDLYIIASPQSPMRDLLASIARQVTLSAPPAGVAPAQTAGGGNKPAGSRCGASCRLVRTPQPGQAAPLPPGHEVDDHFKPLRDFVGNGPGAPIDLVLKSFNEMQQQLAKIAAAPLGGERPRRPPATIPHSRCGPKRSASPQPLSRWLASIWRPGARLCAAATPSSRSCRPITARAARPLCALAVNGRYPFVPGSANDVRLTISRGCSRRAGCSTASSTPSSAPLS